MSKKKKSKERRPPQDWKRSIDLHGMRVDEAIAELDRFINQCILEEGVHQVEVIHGMGTGRVKAAVLDYLKKLTAIQSYHVDSFNPGATWVEL